tara:strand:+ start:593 stop:2014 length:1422 start_codon:yes stop_codon:yes gene_type:complete
MHQLLNRLALHFIFNDHTPNTTLDTLSPIDAIRSTLTKKRLKDPVIMDVPSSEPTRVDPIFKVDVKQYRSGESYSEKTRRILNIITSGEKILPVGSLKYKIHRYPGDIDIYEEIKSCCSLEDATKDIAKKIQKIASDIKKEPSIYLGDFKVGLDERYYVKDIGELDVKNKVINYNADNIKKTFIHLKETHLFTKQDFIVGFDLIKAKPTRQEWYALYDYVRSFYVLRWTLNELISGTKIIGKLSNKIEYRLEEALKAKTVCKLDIWAPINGRYTEITNFLVLIYLDKKGDEHFINVQITDYLQNLIKDLKKYGSGYKKNSLKYAKRLWAIASTLDATGVKPEHEKLKILVPLFSSGAAILYQISAEMEILIDMLTQIKRPPIKNILSQIDDFKMRISYVYEHFLDSEKVLTSIDTIINSYNADKKKLSKEKIKILISNIDEMKVLIDNYVEEYASSYLKKYKLYDTSQYDSIF